MKINYLRGLQTEKTMPLRYKEFRYKGDCHGFSPFSFFRRSPPESRSTRSDIPTK